MMGLFNSQGRSKLFSRVRTQDFSKIGILAVLVFCLNSCPEHPDETPASVDRPLRFSGPTGFETEIPGLVDLRPISFSTYDGSGQVTHPDILAPQATGQPDLYHMVVTPYPMSQDLYENPCLYISADGYQFFELPACKNPLAPAPPYDHNDDPDLMFIDGIYCIYYLETMRPDSQNVILLTSKDRSRWKRQVAVHYDLIAREEFIMSPSVIAFENEYYMFYVGFSHSLGGHGIRYIKSSDGVNWDKKSVYDPNMTMPAGLIPWHIDVFSDGKRFYLLCNEAGKNNGLYLATSNDLQSWIFRGTPLLSSGQDFLNSQMIYRSTGLVEDDRFRVWFSYMEISGEWWVAYAEFDLSLLALN